MKKLISLLIVFCMMIPLSIPVVGATALTEETTSKVKLINYSQYLSDSAANELKNSINAEYVTSTGEIIPIDCVVTVEDILHTSVAARQAGAKSYAVTVSATKKEKTAEGKLNGDNVVATARITMCWTDVLGPYNTMDRLHGSITVTKGTIDHAKVTYGRVHNPTTLRSYFEIGNQTNFDRIVNLTANETGNLHACYETWFCEIPSTSRLIVCVNPTIFDKE